MTEPAKDEAELVEVMAKAHRECWRDRESLRAETRDWPDITGGEHLDCIAQMEAALAAIRAAGWAVVPVEPTDQMLWAADRAPAPAWEMDNPDHVDFVLFCVRRAEWAAMLAAVPGWKP